MVSHSSTREYKRSTLEIYIDLMRAMKHVHKPTNIMYKTNLSWTPLMLYLSSLVEMGLATMTENRRGRGRREYHLTEKGRRALEYFSRATTEVLPVEKLLASPTRNRNLNATISSEAPEPSA